MSQTRGAPPDCGSATNTSTDGRAAPTNPVPTNPDCARRRLLVTATATAGAVGAGLAAWPFAASMQPSAKARALAAPVQFNFSSLEPGQQVTVAWRGLPVWVLRRTPEMLARLNHEHWLRQLRDPDSSVDAQQPQYAQNSTRSIRPEFLVVVALCTHLGCVPTFKPLVADPALGENWMGGYYCPCHGSRFDLAGRVTKNVPAPSNLVVPPHRFLGSDTIEIGVDNA